MSIGISNIVLLYNHLCLIEYSVKGFEEDQDQELKENDDDNDPSVQLDEESVNLPTSPMQE
jgi:hypothetical protein